VLPRSSEGCTRSLIAAVGVSDPGYNKGQIIPIARTKPRTKPRITYDRLVRRDAAGSTSEVRYSSETNWRLSG